MENSLKMADGKIFSWKIDGTNLTLFYGDEECEIVVCELYASSYPSLKPGSPTEQTLLREVEIKLRFDRVIEIMGDMWNLYYDIDASYYTAVRGSTVLEFRLERELYKAIQQIVAGKKDKLRNKAKKIKNKIAGLSNDLRNLDEMIARSK